MKLEYYFLNIKFNITIDKETGKKVKQFWHSFLIKQDDMEIEQEWAISFSRDTEESTKIDYDNKTIIHKHDSICDITEFNNFFRETIVKLSSMSGVVWLHCSAFKFNNKVFLALGKKGDGKTTVLMNALNSLKATFIGNDQLPLFIHKGEVYTYCWRPDIKITTQNDDSKTLYLVNNKIPYSFLDASLMSKRAGKNIDFATHNKDIRINSNKLFKVDNILVLNNKQEIRKTKADFLKFVIDDPEVIIPYKLLNLKKYMPYWNKRITTIKLDPKADNTTQKCLKQINKQCNKYLVGNRLNFEFIKNVLLISDNLKDSFSIKAVNYMKKHYKEYANESDYISISIGGSVARGHAIKTSDIDLICISKKHNTYMKQFIKINGYNIEIHTIPIEYIGNILLALNKYIYITNNTKTININNKNDTSSGAKKCKIIEKTNNNLSSFLSDWRELKKITDSITIYENEEKYLAQLKENVNSIKLKERFKDLLVIDKSFTDFDNFINGLKLISFLHNDIFSKVLWIDLYLNNKYNSKIKEAIDKNIKVKNNCTFYKWYDKEIRSIIKLHSSLNCNFCKDDYMKCNIMRCINDYYNDTQKAKSNGLLYGEFFSIQRVLTYINMIYNKTNTNNNTLNDLLKKYKIDKRIVNTIFKIAGDIVNEENINKRD